ncbi:PWWP domain-containing DNA repair factor 3A-like isoform X2 [Anguilla rostrata]
MTGRDMQDIPQQTSGNDCGIFMLMYALCMCTDAPFHFSMLDMHSIRRWWCVLLMERFSIDGHGQRFAFWTDEASCLLQGILQPVYRVGKGTTMEVPAHIAERTATEQALVDFIVKERGTEEQLLAIISDKEPSKWLMSFQGKSPNKVPVYLDNDAQKNRLFKYMNSISSPIVIRNHILFILEVLFPEAIIGALSALGKMTLQKAAEEFSTGTHLQEKQG